MESDSTASSKKALAKKVAVGIGYYYLVTAVSMIPFSIYMGGADPLWLLLSTTLWPMMVATSPYVWWVVPIFGFAATSGVLSYFDVTSVPERMKVISAKTFGIILGAICVAELLSRVISPVFFVGYVMLYPNSTSIIGLSELPGFYMDGFNTLLRRWDLLYFFGWSLSVPAMDQVLFDQGGYLTPVLVQPNMMAQVFGGIAFSIVLGYSVSLVLGFFIVRSIWRRYGGRVAHLHDRLSNLYSRGETDAE